MNIKIQSVKKSLIGLYAIVIIVMATATFIEHSRGTEYASSEIYSSWWFCGLWALLATVAIVYFVIMRIRRIDLIILHASFVVILFGALVTHIFAIKGIIHLRKGETTCQYMVNNQGDMMIKTLPFRIRLDGFDIKYYEGTTAVSDYVSRLTITDTPNTHNTPNTKGTDIRTATISMNSILTHHSYRFSQSSYDDDSQGTYLTVNSDPYGIAISYIGYILLFISLVWLLVNPKGTYRRLLRSPMLKRGILSAILLCSLTGTVPTVAANTIASNTSTSHTIAATTLPESSAEKFGKLDILYSNRICPVQTFAIDFTQKLYGSKSYNGYTAEQVLAGWLFWSSEWGNEKMIRLKNSEMRQRLQLPEYVSLHSLFNREMGGYILGPYVQEYYQGNKDGFHKAVADIDDKIQMIMSLRQCEQMKLFPYKTGNNVTWYGPTDNLPAYTNNSHSKFIKSIFGLLNKNVQAGDYDQFNSHIDKIRIYQEKNGGDSLPTAAQVISELTYNKIPFASILFMVNLTMGLLTLFYTIYRLTRKQQQKGFPDHLISISSLVILILSFLTLTYCEALRWIISDNIPMANGYETMLLMAWFVMLFALIAYHKFHILLTFGFLMSGFFLLVSHIGQMDPQITPVMPVLASPLLSIHVSVIMMSFALLSLTFICGLMSIALFFIHNGMRHGQSQSTLDSQLSSLYLLSRLFLYPAVVTLGLGIFIGAIWANVSWGQYWSWDPKEVWALITFMFYAVVVHTSSLPIFRKPLYYHIYITLAFVMILMTYFGVNYFLGGMHSYA